MSSLVNCTLPCLRFHTLQTRAFSPLARSQPCTPTSPGPARSSPGLARSSPGPRLASPGLTRPSPGPCLALTHPRFKQSSRQNGQKRNLLVQSLGVSEMASAKMASAIGGRIDDVGSILKFRIGFPFGENSAGFCQSVWLPESILNFRIGSVSSIGGLIATTLSADTISGS